MRGILLLTMARSRSSMTAEIFRRHGVFFGDRKEWRGVKVLGYNENLTFKKWARKARPDLYDEILRGGNDLVPQLDGFQKRWLEALRNEGWDEKSPWGNKVDVFCDKVYEPLDPIKIGIWRNKKDTVDSCQRGLNQKYSKEDWEKIVQKHHDYLEFLNIPVINTDAVRLGVYTSLHEAFEHCGLKLDEQIVRDFVIRD